MSSDCASTPTVFLDLAKLKFLNCGVGQLSLHLANALLARGDRDLQYRLLLPANRRDIFSAHAADCLAVRNWHRQCVRAWSSYLGYRPWRGQPCDLWHWTHQDSEYWPPSTEVPVILNILDLNFLYEGKGPHKTGQRLRRLQAKVDRADSIIAISQFTMQEIQHYLDVRDKSVHVVHMGVSSPDSRLSQRPAFLPPGKFLYAIGDISPKKNFRVLIDLAQRLPDYRFVIAGRNTSQYARDMQNELVQRGMSGQVIMPGQVDDDVRQWLYQNCTAFLFPSLAEGFGLPVIEAMMQGRPVFLSDKTSLPEVGGPWGFYWTDFNPDSMARVFRQGLETVHRDRHYGRKLKHYAATFSWQSAAQKYVDIYRTVLARHGHTLPILPHQRCA